MSLGKEDTPWLTVSLIICLRIYHSDMIVIAHNFMIYNGATIASTSEYVNDI